MACAKDPIARDYNPRASLELPMAMLMFPEESFSDKRQIDFSAQELEVLFPEIVKTDSKGYKSVDYGRMTPILLEAIK